MANIDVDVAGRRYNVACRDGEEEHLRSLAAIVDKRASDAATSPGAWRPGLAPTSRRSWHCWSCPT